MGAILRVARPEMAPRRHVRRRSIAATFHHDIPFQDPASDQIGAKSVEKRQSYCIFSVFGSGAGSGAAAPLPVWRAASSLYFEVVIPWGVTTQNFKPLPWKMAEKKQNEYAEPFEKLTFNLICILS